MESTNHFLKMDKTLRLSELNLLEQYIVCQIAEFIGNGRECYVTNKQFAEWTKYSLSQIEKTMKNLESKHVIMRDVVKFPKKKMRVLSLYPRPEWDVEFREPEEDTKDVVPTENSTSDTHTVNSTVPSTNHTVNSTATSESNRNISGIIDNIEKDNRLEIDNNVAGAPTTPNGDTTAIADTKKDNDKSDIAYTVKFVNGLSEEACIRLAAETTKNRDASNGKFTIKLKTLQSSYGAKPKAHIDFEVLHELANKRANDIRHEKREQEKSGRDLHDISTEEAVSVLSSVLGDDYDTKMRVTPLGSHTFKDSGYKSFYYIDDIRNYMVDSLGFRACDFNDGKDMAVSFVIRRAYGEE